jgi:hypothetical protein
VRLAVLAVVAGLVVGCAERAEPRGTPPNSPVEGTPAPGPTGGVLEVSPRPGLVDVRPHPWDRAEQVGPRRVEVEFYGGVEECEGLARVRTELAEEAVTITLFVGRVPWAEVCIEIAVLKSVTVTLDEALGGRQILDGAAGN